MISAHIFASTTTIPVTDGIDITWGENGDNELSIDNKNILAPLFDQPAQYKIEAHENGSCIWSGRIAEIVLDNGQYHLRAKGDIYQFDQIEDYTEFWSDAGTERWKLYTNLTSHIVAPIIAVESSFDTSLNDGLLYATLRKGSAIPSNSGMAFYWHPPFGSSNRVSQYIATIENRLPVNWNAIIQARDENGTFLENITVAGNDTLKRNLIYKTYTNNPFYLYVILINQTGGTYTVSAESDTYFIRVHDTRILARNQDQSTTTITSSVAPGSAVTVTPASMAGIYEGSKVAFVTSGELVTASQVTPTTFKADLRNGHPSGDTLLIPRMQVSTVVSGIVSPYYNSQNIVIQPSSDDIQRAIYEQENALSVLKELAETGNGIHPFDVFSMRGVFTFRSSTDRPLYYAQADEYSVALDLFGSANKIRATYELGDSRIVTPYVVRTNQIAQLNRTRTIEPNITASGLLTTYLSNVVNQPILSKTSIAIKRLRNQYYGDLDVSALYIPATVRITNIDPILSHIKTNFTLREIRIDADGETEYILDELPDTIETLLAK